MISHLFTFLPSSTWEMWKSASSKKSKAVPGAYIFIKYSYNYILFLYVEWCNEMCDKHSGNTPKLVILSSSWDKI